MGGGGAVMKFSKYGAVARKESATNYGNTNIE